MSVRRAPILEALVRPSLWYGCDPTALTVVSGVSAVVGIGGWWGFGEPLLAPIGALLFWSGRRALLWMAEKDPYQPWIYFRATKYQHLYDARSRWDVLPKVPRRWS